ncbi:M13 family metallopeptidase [Oleisolibacter albus]|uniref:M13 family metallopeptidase n=1 Tax=Oleisolibacter albus TaxID=2171757 RepID=UPI000DF26FEE|nr:M13 family metallopeptidase [Oleisolibacter albus]
MIQSLRAAGVAAFTLALLTGSALAADTTQVAQTAATPKVKAPAAAPAVDPAVSPCEDFFLHACGPWIKENPIPADRSRNGTFDQLEENNKKILHEILDKAAASPTPATRRIGDFYAACMDEKGIEAAGLAPLKPVLSRINAVKDKKDLGKTVADLHLAGVNVLFGFGPQQSFSSAEDTIAAFDQGGMGLPDRDMYLKDDERSKSTRDAYVKHVARMFALAGDKADAAKAKADAVMAFETALAKGALGRVERRDPSKLNNPGTIDGFIKDHPVLDLAGYVKTVGAPATGTLNVNDPGFFTSLDAVLQQTDLATLKTYFTWQALRAAAPWLPDAFVQENFSFYGKTLSGAKELRPRWKRCVDATDSALGEDLGKHYAEVAFGPEHKQRMMAMLDDLDAAYAEDIQKLDWMSPETKAKALEKLKAMARKVGYPETWRDYSALEVKRGDMLGNAVRSAGFEYSYQVGKIGKKVDPDEWFMTPPTVNAYYDPSQNNINFPAGILQPPFFDFKADDATNYGAIGAVIGHEMTHGFDDEGRNFDAKGNLKNWWTEADAKRFEERAQCLVDQYGNYVADGEVKLNGKLTLGENTADNGGVSLALAALRKRLGDTAMDKAQDGLTPTQRFFYGYANVWCSSIRPEAARLRALTDPHSLGRYRVNGVLSNMPEFAKAFNCKPGQAMVKETQCKVW